MGRPRKYATDAERAAAYRARYAVIDVRLTREKLATLDGIAAMRDIPRVDLIANLISWALANRDWRTEPMYTRSVVQHPQTRRTRATHAPTDEGEDDA